MKKRFLILLIMACLLIVFSAQARSVSFGSWHNKLNTEFNYALRYDEGDEPFTSISLNVYHFGGQKDSFFNTTALPEEEYIVIGTQLKSGDYAVITARDEEGYSEQSFTGLAGLPSLKRFEILASVDKPVAAPGDSLTLHVDVLNGQEPYLYVETTCTIGEEYKAFTAFTGEGDFTLNLDKALFAGQSTCVINVEAKDSAGQVISKQLYLQISDAPMEPLQAKIYMMNGDAFYNSARAELDITGGVPPYHFSSLWLVNSLEDDIQMPGEREDDESGSTLTWVEPGFGEVAFTVYDSQGHFIIEKAPFQSVFSSEYAALVNRTVLARSALEAVPAFDPTSLLDDNHLKLLGRWVPKLKNFRGELYFFYDGTFYVNIAETELPRMNLMETFSGVVLVQGKDMKVYQTGRYMDGSTDLPYTLKDGELEIFFSPVESVVFIQDTDFVNQPLDLPVSDSGALSADEAAGPQALAFGDYEYAELADGSLEIVKYKGQEEALSVPGELNGKTVSRIGDEAFIDCYNITSITLPGGVTSIGTMAFQGCANLASITLPDHLTSIGSYAFSHCRNLTSVSLPNGLTSIGDGAFSGCESLKSIALPNGLTSIGDGAFSYCESLTSIALPDSLVHFGDNPFDYCFLRSITVSKNHELLAVKNGVLFSKKEPLLICYPAGLRRTSYQVPQGIQTIGNGAFSRATHLVSVNLPDSVTSIGDGAFAACYDLVSIALPEGLRSIGDGVFEDCLDLTSINLPDSLTHIGVAAFSWCKSLSSITLPNGVTSIAERVFDTCVSLTSITLPDSLTFISEYAFSNCTELTEFIVTQGSYAEQYCKDLGLPYIYTE